MKRLNFTLIELTEPVHCFTSLTLLGHQTLGSFHWDTFPHSSLVIPSIPQLYRLFPSYTVSSLAIQSLPQLYRLFPSYTVSSLFIQSLPQLYRLFPSYTVSSLQLYRLFPIVIPSLPQLQSLPQLYCLFPDYTVSSLSRLCARFPLPPDPSSLSSSRTLEEHGKPTPVHAVSFPTFIPLHYHFPLAL